MSDLFSEDTSDHSVEEARKGDSRRHVDTVADLVRLRDAASRVQTSHGNPATTMLPRSQYDDPAVNPIAFLPGSGPEQDDLTSHDRDYELTSTEKLGPDDERLEQPPQDPSWRPAPGGPG